jgi:hypothetical protein
MIRFRSPVIPERLRDLMKHHLKAALVAAVLAAAPAWAQTGTPPSGADANPPHKSKMSHHTGSSTPAATSRSSSRGQRTPSGTNAETKRLNQQELNRPNQG